jgi:hypothetical protein
MEQNSSTKHEILVFSMAKTTQRFQGFALVLRITKTYFNSYARCKYLGLFPTAYSVDVLVLSADVWSRRSGAVFLAFAQQAPA